MSTSVSILPRFLWNKICIYLTINDLVKLDQSSTYLQSIFKEEDWKDAFLNNRLDDIAVVKNIDTNNYWYNCCTTYIGCTTIKEVFEIIGYQEYNQQFKDQYMDSFAKKLYDAYNNIMAHKNGACDRYQVYFKRKIFKWDGFDIGSDLLSIAHIEQITDIKFSCNYKIELIGSGDITDHNCTIFESYFPIQSSMNILVPQYLSICNIVFNNVSLFLHRDYDFHEGNLYYKPKKVCITDCLFYNGPLQYSKIEYVIVTNCIFYTNIIMRHTESGNYKEYNITITNNIFHKYIAACIIMITSQKNILIEITNNEFMGCDKLFSLTRGSIYMNPIIFLMLDAVD